MNRAADAERMFGLAECTRRYALALGASILLNGGAYCFSPTGRSSALKKVAFSTDTTVWHYREYAVHATVMLGSLPLYSKRDVGGAAMSFEQAVQNRSATTGLQFVAGSWPDRLHGFNRLGALRETVQEEDGTVTQSSYAGFMSTSREKGMADARNAFLSSNRTQIMSVSSGRATNGGCTFASEQRTLNANQCWTSSGLLDSLVRDQTLPPEECIAHYGPGCLPTFLFAVRHALVTDTERPTTYIHNGKVYRVRLRSKGERDSEIRLITGWTSVVGERSETEFKFWIAADDPTALPVKIEFRARNFLKLTLEAEQSSPRCVLRPLFTSRSEQA